MTIQKTDFYQNRWEYEVLYITVIGRKRNQSLEKPWQNRDLTHCKEKDMKLNLFEKQKPSHYEYKGEAKVLDEPIHEKQKDIEGNPRTVYVFPVKLKS